MELVQAIQPFQGLKTRVITFPQRKAIIETIGWTAFSSIPKESAKIKTDAQIQKFGVAERP
jgi:hypothetical protein